MKNGLELALRQLRLQLAHEFCYGSLDPGLDAAEAWSAAFHPAPFPDRLALLRLSRYGEITGSLSDGELRKLHETLRSALNQSLSPSAAGEHLGGSLFAAFGSSKQAAFPRLCKEARAALAKAWGHDVKLSGVEAAQGLEGLSAAFMRAESQLELSGSPQPAPAALEDSLPPLEEALRFGKRQEARPAFLRAVNAALNPGLADVPKRYGLMKILRACAQAAPAADQAALYDLNEAVILAPKADANLASTVVQKFEGLLRGLSPAAPDRGKDLVRRVKARLKARLNEDPSLKDLAKEFGVSQSLLSRAFRKESGMPLPRWHNRLRVEEAGKLLLNSSQSVMEISENVGFKDFHYFCTVFKSVTGTPPATYRRQGRA